MSSQSAIRIAPRIEPEAEPDASPDSGEKDTTSWIRSLQPRGWEPDVVAPIPPNRVPQNLGLPHNSVAHRIIAALMERGIDTFFGVPGGPVAPLFEALRQNSAATLVEVRHESHAAFAAVSYFRITGRVAAVVVTAGPGVTNAVTGVASAFSEAAPMVVISGDVAWASHGGRLVQCCGPEGLNIEQMFAPITRAQVRVTNGRSAVSQTIAAFEAATNPLSMGPALLVVPMDRATEEAPEISLLPAKTSITLGPADGTVLRTAKALAEAGRPLLVLGKGCWAHREVVRSLVDVLSIPFVTTPSGKGVVGEDHPRSLRNGGMAASHWARRYVAGGVDVALVLGTDLDDASVGPTPYIQEGGTLIHVDLNPEVFNRNLPTELGITADLALFCSELYNTVLELGLTNTKSRQAVKEIRAESPYDRPDFAQDGRKPIPPDTAIANLQAALPEARFTSDIGEHMLFCLHYLKANRPGDFSMQLGLGSMGSGIAGATGLALADPERPVVCVCGDGGMQMSGMEILTAKKLGLRIVYAVFNDSRYNMVYHGMKQLYGEAQEFDAPEVDFSAWAHSMGVPATTIVRGGEITSNLLRSLLCQGGPALLDIRIDREMRIRGGGRVESLQRMSVASGRGA